MRRTLMLIGLSVLLSHQALASAPMQVDFLTYAVDSEGSTQEKTSFDSGERPYVYALIPALPEDTVSVYSQWGLQLHDFTTAFPPHPILASTPTLTVKGQSEFWFTPADWESVKEPGRWFAGVTFSNPQFQNHTGPNDLYGGYSVGPKLFGGRSSFTVTPEPASMLLFGLGAGVLGFAKKKFKGRS